MTLPLNDITPLHTRTEKSNLVMKINGHRGFFTCDTNKGVFHHEQLFDFSVGMKSKLWRIPVYHLHVKTVDCDISKSGQNVPDMIMKMLTSLLLNSVEDLQFSFTPFSFYPYRYDTPRNKVRVGVYWNELVCPSACLWTNLVRQDPPEKIP